VIRLNTMGPTIAIGLPTPRHRYWQDGRRVLELASARCSVINLTWIGRVMQANVLKQRVVHPLGDGRECERDADFGSVKCRSNLVVHRLDPWEPFGKQFDQRFVLPTIENKPEPDACTVPV
jgi:hypothetical protein